MSRDYRQLKVFVLADRLVLETYRVSACFPHAERYGLQAQIRRAAVSAAANIVEGSARHTTREWLNFLNIASGSATEAYYLAHVARRLTLVEEQEAIGLEQGYSELGASLRAMSRVLREKSASTQRPEAKG
jgi:four helix bundle protein